MSVELSSVESTIRSHVSIRKYSCVKLSALTVSVTETQFDTDNCCLFGLRLRSASVVPRWQRTNKLNVTQSSSRARVQRPVCHRPYKSQP